MKRFSAVLFKRFSLMKEIPEQAQFVAFQLASLKIPQKKDTPFWCAVILQQGLCSPNRGRSQCQLCLSRHRRCGQARETALRGGRVAWWRPKVFPLLKWLWVKNQCPKWNPGKWKSRLKPAVPWWFNFDPYPNKYCLFPLLPSFELIHTRCP